MRQESRPQTEDALFRGAPLAVLLGSGLDAAVEGLRTDAVLPFDKIEGLTAPTVPGHKGELRRCVVGKRPCVFVCGRKHHYEGSRNDVAVLIRFLHSIGVRRLILTSAAGSLVKFISPGELILAVDVIDAQFRRPVGARLREAHDAREGTGRFALDPVLSRRIWAAAARAKVGLGRGPILTVAGPMYETPAEIRAFQETGASVVTMSGAPEIEEAGNLGMSVAMISAVTNWASGISGVRLRHEDVLEVGRAAARNLRQLIVEFAGTDQD